MIHLTDEMPFWLIDSKIDDDIKIFSIIINKQESDLSNFQESESKVQTSDSPDLEISVYHVPLNL